MTVQTNSKDKATTDLLAQIEALKAENAKLKEARNARISYKVSEKGALSFYGLGRFPVTLYRGQWERLFAVVDEIKKVYPGQLSKAGREAVGRWMGEQTKLAHLFDFQ